jgi:hypothetical protein
LLANEILATAILPARTTARSMRRNVKENRGRPNRAEFITYIGHLNVLSFFQSTFYKDSYFIHEIDFAVSP